MRVVNFCTSQNDFGTWGRGCPKRDPEKLLDESRLGDPLALSQRPRERLHLQSDATVNECVRGHDTDRETTAASCQSCTTAQGVAAAGGGRSYAPRMAIRCPSRGQLVCFKRTESAAA
jgi:hypothetical protein